MEQTGQVAKHRWNKNKLYEALAEVETGNNPKAVGFLGERGATQIRPQPFDRPDCPIFGLRDKELAKIVETIDIVRGNNLQSLSARLLHFYMIWNGGPSYANRHLKAGKVSARAIRFVNIYLDQNGL